jgi:hypothetical protein
MCSRNANCGGKTMELQDRLTPLVDEGLGNSAYLLDLGTAARWPSTRL